MPYFVLASDGAGFGDDWTRGRGRRGGGSGLIIGQGKCGGETIVRRRDDVKGEVSLTRDDTPPGSDPQIETSVRIRISDHKTTI